MGTVGEITVANLLTSVHTIVHTLAAPGVVGDVPRSTLREMTAQWRLMARARSVLAHFCSQ